VLDWGYDAGVSWTDFNADGKADYCRGTGAGNNVDWHLQCTLSTGTGFGASYTSVVLDWGYDAGVSWTDFNADGKADYCRVIGGSSSDRRAACTVSTGTGFGATYTSPVLDSGYQTGRFWADFDGDGRADY